MNRRQRGFTLLEAIVALTIFSICAMALYAWLATNVRALGRVQASTLAVQDGRAALAVLETINPMTEPSGERTLLLLVEATEVIGVHRFFENVIFGERTRPVLLGVDKRQGKRFGFDVGDDAL